MLTRDGQRNKQASGQTGRISPISTSMTIKRIRATRGHLNRFSSGTSLGGKVSRYRRKQNIYAQGARAHTLFFIQEGGVQLSTRTEHQPSVVTATLGVSDFFGEL